MACSIITRLGLNELWTRYSLNSLFFGSETLSTFELAKVYIAHILRCRCLKVFALQIECANDSKNFIRSSLRPSPLNYLNFQSETTSEHGKLRQSHRFLCLQRPWERWGTRKRWATPFDMQRVEPIAKDRV